MQGIKSFLDETLEKEKIAGMAVAITREESIDAAFEVLKKLRKTK